MRNHQEGTALEQHHLISLNGLTEQLQTQLQLFDVRQENADDLRPSLVESFVPDAGLEALSFVLKVGGCLFEDLLTLVLEHCVSLILQDQVHLVNETEDLSLCGKFSQCINARLVVSQITSCVLGCHIEDEDENLNILENVFSL